MKFEYTGRHIDVTPALKTHVEDHFKRIDHLFNGDASKAHVTIEVERGRHRAEVVVNWRNEILTATTSLSDMYQSLAQSIAKIEKQALRIKNKVIDKSHRARRASSIIQSEVTPTPSAPKIMRSRRYAIKPMTDEEAALILSDGEASFLVYRNAENQKFSVLYKRKDGNFGLIEP